MATRQRIETARARVATAKAAIAAAERSLDVAEQAMDVTDDAKGKSKKIAGFLLLVSLIGIVYLVVRNQNS